MIKYEIKENLGVVSESNRGWRKEFNLVSWNEKEAKYDLRDWDINYKQAGKGITLTTDSVKKLKEILNKMDI